MGWFATDPRIAESLLRMRIGDEAIVHVVAGVGKRCLFCTRDALYLVTYRRPLFFLRPRLAELSEFPLSAVSDLVLEVRGEGTVCRLGIATAPEQVLPEGTVPDAQAILFVTLVVPRYREVVRDLRYRVESAQFKASWETGGRPGAESGV